MQMFCEKLLLGTKGSDSKRRQERKEEIKESSGSGRRVSALWQIQLLIRILLIIPFSLCQ